MSSERVSARTDPVAAAPRPAGSRSDDGRGDGSAILIEAACAVLARLGADPARLFAEAGLASESSRSEDEPVSGAALGQLIAYGVDHTHCPDLGLRIGQRVTLTSLGPVGTLLRNSETVGDAMHALEVHPWGWNCGAAVRLCVEGDLALFCYLPFEPGADEAGFRSEGALATSTNVVRTLCGASWTPLEVLLPRSAPEETTPYRSFFGAPVRFDQEMAAMVFPSRLLKERVAGADAAARRLAEGQVLRFEAAHPTQFADALRRLLRSEVVAERWRGISIARHLSLHRRTLSRRLRAEGTTFRSLAQETRFEIAKQLLVNTNLSLVQISASLDFSESAAFSHAFRRWSGTTPTAWRAAHQHPGRVPA
ncbi:AraC family transcriptional regulator [Methylobacterium durans]|uniref:AraC family transcriptional regulator n=1 Tax=Methylobacterium durans TaxID=2202825 RepID=A0A2U8W1T8_9HYPH|nr:AraC family transcriptional regulator [Methylobacterium durans]AWN40037.1 AraC family transcriptional regulator [Methylobacterium durans]